MKSYSYKSRRVEDKSFGKLFHLLSDVSASFAKFMYIIIFNSNYFVPMTRESFSAVTVEKHVYKPPFYWTKTDKANTSTRQQLRCKITTLPRVTSLQMSYYFAGPMSISLVCSGSVTRRFVYMWQVKVMILSWNSILIQINRLIIKT